MELSLVESDFRNFVSVAIGEYETFEGSDRFQVSKLVQSSFAVIEITGRNNKGQVNTLHLSVQKESLSNLINMLVDERIRLERNAKKYLNEITDNRTHDPDEPAINEGITHDRW